MKQRSLFAEGNEEWIETGKNYLYHTIFTVHKRSLGQGNIFTSVCHSVHREICPTSSRQTPDADRPGCRIPAPHPEIDGILWDTVNKRSVRILLQCFLVHICKYLDLSDFYSKISTSNIFNFLEIYLPKYFQMYFIGNIGSSWTMLKKNNVQ